jgi:hypothetical protein
MTSWIEPVLQVFEILVQGALVAIVLAYLVSAQRRWQARLVWFADGMRVSLQSALGTATTSVDIVRIPILIGIIYFLGILGNTVGFGVMRDAHEVLIHEVYLAADANALPDVTTGASQAIAGSTQALDPRSRIRETSYLGLMTVAMRTIWKGLRHPLSAATQAVPSGDRDCYLRYMHDEATWRNANREAASSILDPLLKQSRIARGTAIATLFMTFAAGLRTILFSCCLAVAIVAKQLHDGRTGRGAAWVLHWCDRRFVRRDERITGEPDRGGGPRPLKEVSGEIRRLLWTHLLVGMSAALIALLAMGGYKMVEREYHMEVLYGSRAALAVEARTAQKKEKEPMSAPSAQTVGRESAPTSH